MKDMIKFLIKCSAVLAAATLILVGLNKPYAKMDDEKYMDLWNLRMLGNQIPYVTVANVGSSHGAYDFVYDGFETGTNYFYNFGNVSQTYNYDLAMLKEYGDYLQPGGILFIPISYFSFNNEVVNDSEAQALSIKYYHCLSPENVPNYDLFTDIVTHKMPILSAGEDLLKLFPNLAIRAQAAEPAAASDTGNDASSQDSAADVSIDVEEFSNRAKDRYNRHFENKDNYFLPEREEELKSIIAYCKGKQLTPILITTPFSSYYQNLVSEEFLTEFHAKIDEISASTGVLYYDYSCDERFRDNLAYFSDSDHLNEVGAHYFMEILAEEIPEFQQVLNKNR